MSRIGLQPIEIHKDVKVTIEKGGEYGNQKISVNGPKGDLTLDMRHGIEVKKDDETNILQLERKNDSKQNKSLHGLYRSIIANMIDGVVNGFEKNLEIHGVGYRVKKVGNDLELSLGWTHPVLFKIPENITADIVEETNIKISGIDKQMVGQIASDIRELRPPEPYKGKGIRYQGEYVRRKVGKTAAS